MKLLCVFAAVLVVTLAVELETKNEENIEDMVAAETMELLKETQDLSPAASAYNYVTNQNYVPSNQNYAPPNQQYIPPNQQYIPPNQNYNPSNQQYSPPNQNYIPSNQNFIPPVQKPWNPPAPAPQNPPAWTPPQQQPIQPIHTHVPPYAPPQNDAPYKPVQGTWTPPQVQHDPTTTPASVIQNDAFYGTDGSYKYEYQISDGTHVSEQGYYTGTEQKDENIVKKGSYSFPGADGKVYTVTWWADHTGFHAFGEHLPTPPPPSPAIQAALDQAAKEEAEKNKPQQDIYYPQSTQKPYYPPTTQKPYYPPPQQQYPQNTNNVYAPPPVYNPPQYNNPTYG